jgi:glycosyltransferase involved in cell wall biosynthesis
MQILIYESSSFGGCYQYAREIFPEFKGNTEVSKCTLLLPKNSNLTQEGIRCILIRDQISSNNKLVKKIHFLYRNFLNPFILFFILLKRKNKTHVILNDFEQISAPLWAPLFKLFLGKKHVFIVVLHDADRDEYPPSKAFSVYCMKKLMAVMDFGFYHGYLPDKTYYQCNPNTVYIDIPHGQYKLPEGNFSLSQHLESKRTKDACYLSILGNIREQKNYRLTIQALPSLPKAVLIIAGAPSNSGVDVREYKELANKLKVDNRIIWIEKFLTESEITSLISFSDIILLNYAKNFSSQSGIFNMIAPFEKSMIISKGNSSLSVTAKKFNLGHMIEPDNLESLIFGVQKLMNERENNNENWDDYLKYASWKNLTEITLTAFKEKTK